MRLWGGRAAGGFADGLGSFLQRRGLPSSGGVGVSYQPMSLAELARFIAAEPDFDTRWRLVAEFLKEYHEPGAAAVLASAGTDWRSRWDCWGLPSTCHQMARTRRIDAA